LASERVVNNLHHTATSRNSLEPLVVSDRKRSVTLISLELVNTAKVNGLPSNVGSVSGELGHRDKESVQEL